MKKEEISKVELSGDQQLMVQMRLNRIMQLKHDHGVHEVEYQYFLIECIKKAGADPDKIWRLSDDQKTLEHVIHGSNKEADKS